VPKASAFTLKKISSETAEAAELIMQFGSFSPIKVDHSDALRSYGQLPRTLGEETLRTCRLQEVPLDTDEEGLELYFDGAYICLKCFTRRILYSDQKGKKYSPVQEPRPGAFQSIPHGSRRATIDTNGERTTLRRKARETKSSL